MSNGLLKSIVAVTLLAVAGVVVVAVFVPEQATGLTTTIFGFAGMALLHLVTSSQQRAKIERSDKAAAIRARRVTRKIDATSKDNVKIMEEAHVGLKKEVVEIHEAVNSKTDKLLERLASAEKQVLEVSKLLAASQTTQVLAGVQALAPKPDAPTEVLIVGSEKTLPVDVVEKADEPAGREGA